MEKEKVIVMFGGKSAEHDISIITGLQTLKNVDREKYDVFPVYLSREGEMFFGKKLENINTYFNFNSKNLKKVTFKTGSKNIFLGNGKTFKKWFEVGCVILCCHGLNGEDGTIQGLFELCEIPYTSPNVLSSSICMDKIIMKDVLRANLIKTPDSFSFKKTDFYFNEKEILNEIEKKLGLFENFCFVKPANLGSSIGISKCKTREELEEAINVAGNYDERIIVEKSIENATEVNCAVLGNADYQIASNLEYPTSWSSFLNFEEKYILRNKAGNIIEENNKEEAEPKTKKQKKLSEKLESKVKEIAIKAFKIFNCSGVVRIDFLVDKENEIVYLNELNSIPGSLSFYLFKDQGFTFTKLINKLIDFSKKKMKDKLENKYSFSSNALVNFGAGNKMNKYTK